MMKSLEKCKKCGEERHVLPSRLKMKTYTGLCIVCYKASTRGVNHPLWSGGIQKTSPGYVLVWLDRDDFFFPMAQRSGYVLEHRLVMAKHLNRCLLAWEVIHHINGVKDDNRLENLLILKSDSNHNKTVDKIIKRLKRENEILRTQVAELEGRND